MIVLNPKTKRKVEIISLLGGVWFVVSLPLPWIIGDPNVAREQLLVILQIIGFISIPFVALAIAWTLKPELTQNS